MSPSPVAGMVYIGTNSSGQGVVLGTRYYRASSVAEALAWCDEHSLQVMNRQEAEDLAEADALLAQVAPF